MRAVEPGMAMVFPECAAARQAETMREAARVHRRDDLLARLPALFRKVRQIVAHEWDHRRKRVN